MEINPDKNRRNFIKNTLSASVLIATGMESMAVMLSSCSTSKKSVSATFKTGFDQTPLPYKYNELEDVIDATTMEIHYSKHATAYSKNLKEAALAENVNQQESLETILGKISRYSAKLRNNGGGHYNHEMFWQCMQSKKTDNKPGNHLLTALEKQFGSFADFKKQFSESAKTRFGSGWAWLYLDANGKLKIGSTANQDNPLMDISTVEPKGFPLLCIDVWEHAYYLKYQNKRGEYIERWWEVVNWDYVEKRYKAAI